MLSYVGFTTAKKCCCKINIGQHLRRHCQMSLPIPMAVNQRSSNEKQTNMWYQIASSASNQRTKFVGFTLQIYDFAPLTRWHLNWGFCYHFLSPFYVNSFILHTARLWNFLPTECFLLMYDLNGFKYRINRPY